MKCLFFSVLSFLMTTTTLFSQTAVSEFGNEFLPFLETAKKQALELATILPEEKYSYLPAAGGRTAEQELLHMAYEPYYLSKIFMEKVTIKYEPYENKKNLSKQEIIDMISQSFEQVKKALQNITEDELKQTINVYGMKMTRKQLFYYITDHNTSHAGKLKLVARMLGLTPPEYKFMYN